MKVIAVTNQKGGAGKTTTAHAIGAGLKRKCKRVLYLDLDAQGNLTYTLGADTTKDNIATLLQLSIEDKLTATAIRNAIQWGVFKGDIIPSAPTLANADAILADVTGREYKIKEILKPIKKNYDYVIIDTPPTLSTLTINALTAADYVIAPAQAEVYSLIALDQLYSTISTVKKYCNPRLSFKGIVLTRYNGRAVISKEIAERMAENAESYNTKLFETKIRECTAIKECEISQQDIFSYAPNSNAAIDYENLVEEILEEE